MAKQSSGAECLVGEGIEPLTELHTQGFSRKLLMDRHGRIVAVEHMHVERPKASRARHHTNAARWRYGAELVTIP
jgi:hypothetical protein